VTEAQLAAWEAAGRRAAQSLPEDAGAIVVLGKGVESTARAALGLARALAETRQVALADLLGESATLAALVDDPAAPGIADSFVHGVSLNRVARPVPGTERLFILPAGGIEAAASDVLASTRWDRLARGFRQVNALLIVAASADEPEAEGLARRLGGAMAVGTDVVLGPDVRTLATLLPLPAAVAPREPADPAGDAESGGRLSAARLTPPLTYVLPGEAGADAVPVRRRVIEFVALLAAVVVGYVVVQRLQAPKAAPAVVAAAPVELAPPVDTVPIDTTGLVIDNPADSGVAVGFTVELLAANTLGGAVLTLKDSLPAGTVAPALLGPSRARWFRVVAGAFATRRDADSLLADLVRRKRAPEGSARVIQAPLAFRLEAGVSFDTTPLALTRWRRTGLPVYALVQDDGKVTIFTGAFERLDQAALLVPALRAANVPPDLAYRTGRTY
jgi:hypothetical protein